MCKVLNVFITSLLINLYTLLSYFLFLLTKAKVAGIAQTRNNIRFHGQLFVNGGSPNGNRLTDDVSLQIIKTFAARNKRHNVSVFRRAFFKQSLISKYHRCSTCLHWINENKRFAIG